MLTGRLTASGLPSGKTTTPAEFHGTEASGTVHLDDSLPVDRVRADLPGEVRLCWLPGTTPARWQEFHAAVLVDDTGRYVPVGIRRLSPVAATRPGPTLGAPLGPYPWAAGRYRLTLGLTVLLGAGVLCSGVLVPSTADPAGFDNTTWTDLNFAETMQCCLLVVPLIGLLFAKVDDRV
ncbi:hypothetical protein [Plantactinospora sonchi]|uniref:Uncharacterized protein n=1 Tax=Plantactinospora sonchi TaxID=1544735 RepID=A0ABU7RXZ9_9ACTN